MSTPVSPPFPSTPFVSLTDVLSITVDSNVEYMYSLYTSSGNQYIAKINATTGSIINAQFINLGYNNNYNQILLVGNNLYLTEQNYIYIIDITSVNNDAFAIAGSNAIGGGIYYSINNGESWSGSTGGQVGQYLNSGISRNINNAVIASGSGYGIFYSVNGGQSWLPSSITTGNYNITLSNNGITVIAYDDSVGLWYSVNGGQTFTSSSGTGISSIDFKSVGISGDGIKAVAISNSSNGIYYSNDSGASWSQSSSSVTTSRVFSYVAMSNNGINVIASPTNGIYYSLDSGVTWSISDNSSSYVYNSIAISDDGTKAIAVSNSSGIWYSTTYGQTWLHSDIQSGSFTVVSLSGDGTKAIAIDSNSIYYYSTNGGQSWSLSSGIPGGYNKFSLSSDGIHAIASSTGNNGIYYSNDGGQTWSLSNLTSSRILTVAIQSLSIRTPWFTSSVANASLSSLATDGTYIYVGDTVNNIIMRVNITTPVTPSSVAWANLLYSPSYLTINNNYLYASCPNGTSSTSYISRINTTGTTLVEDDWVVITGYYSTGIAIYGSYMYLALKSNTTPTPSPGYFVGLIYISSSGTGILENTMWISIPNSSVPNNQLRDVLITQKNQYVNLYISDDIFEIVLYTPPPISDICFPAGTLINTDQGRIAIEKINPNINTINNKRIVDIIKTIYNDNYLVGFRKHAITKNYPSEFTVMTKNHKIIWEGVKYDADSFLYRYENVVKVKYNGQILYNVLMEQHSEMIVNNMLCETLDPNNVVAKLYNRYSKYSRKDRYNISNLIINNFKTTKFNPYRRYKNIIKKL
jgi:photosystem II stability/assembly factor-like uncharacterized protein